MWSHYFTSRCIFQCQEPVLSVLGAALSKNETGKSQTSAHPAELNERRFKKMTKDIVCVSSGADSDKIHIDYFDKRKRLLP